MPHDERLNKSVTLLEKYAVDALIIEAPIDLFYLTNTKVSSGKLLIQKESSTLFVDSRYIEEAAATAPCDTELLSEIAFLKKLAPSVKTIAFDSSFTTYNHFLLLQKKLPQQKLKPIENLLTPLRSIKDPQEIEALKAAADLGSRGWDYAISLLKEGISEEEIATEIEIFWKNNGGKRPAFDINISFGSNSSMPHHRADQTKLSKGDTILMDIGVVLDGYNSDMTRVLFFGEPDVTMLSIYKIVQEAQQAALDKCRPGVSLGELDNAARYLIEEKGYGKEFSHGLGHGIGLQVHEYPHIRNKPPHQDDLLKPGMAITIEPGIYLPNIGGVRIEDSIIITEEGFEDLTKRSKELTLLPVS